MKSSRRYIAPAVLSVITAALIGAHAKEDEYKLKIDEVTVALLAIGALPWLDRFLQSIKAGGVELHFHSLKVEDQLLFFLEAIGRQKTWTFYRARDGREEELGAAFGIMADQLYRDHHQKLCEKIEEWVASPNENLRWFAAEIVGYYKMTDLRENIKKPENVEGRLKPWQLNSIWALSRFEPDYKPLQDFLIQTRDARNQEWVLEAYEQMIESGEIDLSIVIGHLREFVRVTGSSTLKKRAVDVIRTAELALERPNAN